MAKLFSEGSLHAQGVQHVPFKTSDGSLKVLLLHGNLDIWVEEAKNLPKNDLSLEKFGKMFSGLSCKIEKHIPQKIATNSHVTSSVFKAKRFGKKVAGVSSKIEKHIPTSENRIPHGMKTDPYVTISVSNAVIGKTFVKNDEENPVWMQHFCLPVAHYAAEVLFVVKNKKLVGSETIGVAMVPVEQIYSGIKVEGTFPLINSSGKPYEPESVLIISIQYTPIDKVAWDHVGVPDAYFPLRKGGKVTLYQDTHVPDEGCLPNLNLEHGIQYEHGDCWRDISDAISQARHLVYITGWSVYHKVRLVRGKDNATDCNLGDLLKTKAQEKGVKVLLLLWDDPSSLRIFGHIREGKMHTHDEETCVFFKHSLVKVLPCRRSFGNAHSIVRKQELGKIYSHHQKTVIVDADAGHGKRKIIAFLGGLDLAMGRYDTPKHPILSTLQTVHKDDYHNLTFKKPAVGCPRQPWHDLHCRIDGPAAYDILNNFEQRWLKASIPSGLRKVIVSSHNDSLLKTESISDILGMDDVLRLREDDPEAWHVQVFRSIDSNSVKGFPEDPKDATEMNLVCGKNVLIDMSIHTAYVKAIRDAKHFIYIENQYFLGSSYNWTNHQDLGANNLIPMEIALKIANKIRADERFSAYIVIPMWPEGDPTSCVTQQILYWQYNTMQMMYEEIYKVLQEVGLDNKYEPQDYLNFFCLGNREAQDTESTSNHRNPFASKTPEELTTKYRRFMIYVHSKGMIVDDEYVILGSANINQRSLEGTRDTEIAMGAYQPRYTRASKCYSPHGQIYGYRMSLWAEHIGFLEECFEQPDSLECTRRVRSLSELNWKQYVADKVTEMKGHLLKYPVAVDPTGKVKPLPGCETFPDVGGNIVGTFRVTESITI
ncbi:phospholipase D gamma 1-like [Cornus florida]|uniref:phospholipase D gamma 1-like n=1 Tax=Cornus florida TaxID=4283 RepID=UPI00289B06C0|nr:phospholipase D gamma 1-like [Cornus florida]